MPAVSYMGLPLSYLDVLVNDGLTVSWNNGVTAGDDYHQNDSRIGSPPVEADDDDTVVIALDLTMMVEDGMVWYMSGQVGATPINSGQKPLSLFFTKGHCGAVSKYYFRRVFSRNRSVSGSYFRADDTRGLNRMIWERLQSRGSCKFLYKLRTDDEARERAQEYVTENVHCTMVRLQEMELNMHLKHI